MKGISLQRKRYLDFLKAIKRSPNTIASYGLDLEHFTKNSIKAKEVNESVVQRYLVSLEKGGASYATVRRRAVCLKGFLKFLNSRGAQHQLQKLSTPAHRFATAKLPPQKAIDKLLEDPAIHPSHAAGRFVYHFGFIVKEIETLKKDQFTIAGNVISTKIHGEKIEVNDPVLAQWIMNQEHNDLFVLTRRMLEIGLKKIHSRLNFRLLRHACVARWISEGLTLPRLQARLGLKTSFSLSLYKKLIPKNMPVAADLSPQ